MTSEKGFEASSALAPENEFENGLSTIGWSRRRSQRREEGERNTLLEEIHFGKSGNKIGINANERQS